jgi:hypothetical protein
MLKSITEKVLCQSPSDFAYHMKNVAEENHEVSFQEIFVFQASEV